MRSKFPAVIAAAMIVLFAACSGTATTPATSTPTAAQTAAASATEAATATPTEAASATISAGCVEGASGAQTVVIQGFAFSPTQLTVDAGTSVTWTNADGVTHTATADDDSFDCRPINGGASMTFTFTTPGTYAYHCAIHPAMKAEVVVK